MNGSEKKIKFDKVVLDCLNPQKLADFYIHLLRWHKGYDKDGFVIIGSETSNVDIAFQQNEDYVPPTWPDKAGNQQQMLHLDFAVDPADQKYWVEQALSLGARVADEQFSEHWTVMLDPEGHPFCIDAM